MKRYLSIVLDELCITSKSLIVDESCNLDRYILNKFSSSEDIRKCFHNEISIFLNNNANLIKSIEGRINKLYRGQIVILEVLENGSIKRVKVIYKKDIQKIKNEYLPDQNLMRKFIMYNHKYFSRYIINNTKRILSDTSYKRMIGEWYKSIKDGNDFFEICRSILKFVDLNKKQEKEYNQYIGVTSNNVTYNNEEDILDDNYDPDLDFHPDLDDVLLGRYSTEDDNFESHDNEVVDDSSKEKIKVKRKKMEIAGQMSFFD